MAVVDTAENIEHIGQFRAYIQEQKMMIAFTGAGTSVFPGIPAWEKFVIELDRTLNTNLDINLIIERDGVLAAASCIYDELPLENKGDFYQGISQIIQRAVRFASYDLHAAILGVFNRIATTNYDTCFEEGHEMNNFTLQKVGHPGHTFLYQRIPTLDYSQFTATDKSLAYLHGRIDTEQIILRREDYLRYYPTINCYTGADKNTNLEAFIEKIIENYSFVFIGFSLDDENFVKTYEALNDKIKENLKTTTDMLDQYINKKHFIILSNSDVKDWIDLGDLTMNELDPNLLIQSHIMQYKVNSTEKLEFRLNYKTQLPRLSLDKQEKVLSLDEILIKNRKKLSRLRDLGIVDIRYEGRDYKAVRDILIRNGKTVTSSDTISVNDL